MHFREVTEAVLGDGLLGLILIGSADEKSRKFVNGIGLCVGVLFHGSIPMGSETVLAMNSRRR